MSTPDRYRKLRCSIFVTLLLSSSSAVLAQDQINWRTDLIESKRIAKESGKPLLYDFTAKWCGPCKRMDKEFWTRADVVDMSKQFVCVKVDFDREKELAQQYGIRAIPNVVFTDPWGRGLLGQRGFGAGSDVEILEKIKLLPKSFSSLTDAGNKLEANEKDTEALYKFAVFYQEQKLYWLGNEYYMRLISLETDPLKRENVLTNVAFNHLRMDRPADAIDRIEALRKEYPNSPQTDMFLYGLVLANASKNNVDVATKHLTDLKKKFPASQYIAPASARVNK